MEAADLLPTFATATKKSSSFPSAADTPVVGKGRYKFYALTAILLLAFGSMLTATGTVTLKSSSMPILTSWSVRSPFLLSLPIYYSLLILIQEVEESEKVVRQMRDVYAHSRRIRLRRFWQKAFETAC